MCTLALFARVLPDFPLVVAANRDELYARPTTSPLLLAEDPRVVGGRDLVAGGTWLAVGEQPLIVGLLNRRTGEPPDPKRESRGALCVDLARHPSAESAARSLEAVDADRHNPFNLVIADPNRVFVAQNRDSGMAVEELAVGTHLLTNLNLNDSTCPRISRSSRRFSELGERFATTTDRSGFVAGLRGILSDHLTAVDDRQPTDQLCIHTAAFGTRSSSIVMVGASGSMIFLHAPGPPCVRPYRRVGLPWAAT